MKHNMNLIFVASLFLALHLSVSQASDVTMGEPEEEAEAVAPAAQKISSPEQDRAKVSALPGIYEGESPEIGNRACRLTVKKEKKGQLSMNLAYISHPDKGITFPKVDEVRLGKKLTSDTEYRTKNDKNMDKNRSIVTHYEDQGGLSIGWKKENISDASMQVHANVGHLVDPARSTSIYCNSLKKVD